MGIHRDILRTGASLDAQGNGRHEEDLANPRSSAQFSIAVWDGNVLCRARPRMEMSSFFTPASLKTQRHQDPFFVDEPESEGRVPSPGGDGDAPRGVTRPTACGFSPLRLCASARKLPFPITQPRTDLARRRRGAEKTHRSRSGSSSRTSRLRVRQTPSPLRLCGLAAFSSVPFLHRHQKQSRKAAKPRRGNPTQSLGPTCRVRQRLRGNARIHRR
jgi:hypothetical protein